MDTSRRVVLLILAGSLVALAAAGAGVSFNAHPTTAAKQCQPGTVRAVIAGKQTCLQAGQPCKRNLDPKYHRYGFHCHTGRLTRTKPAPAPRLVTIKATGPPETVFDWTTDRCENLDIPDLPARAFRDADGNVQLISAHYVNRRFVGLDLDRVRHACEVIMESSYNPDPAAFDDHEWISATWTPDGSTVYALIHDEYQGNAHPGHCPSGEYIKCWYNAITLAVSTDGGRTYADRAPSKLVASAPYQYVPDDGPIGVFDPSNIVRGRRDGYFYALVRLNLRDQTFGNCLIRTKDLSDPTSWRAWTGGTRFDTTFVDPYGPSPNPESHLCKGVSPDAFLDLVPGTITYNSVARQWLLVGVRAGGFYYSTSPDLINWRPALLFSPEEVPWTYNCGDADPVHYPALIDPASTSRNFETSGKTAFLYYTQFHTQNCNQGLDRDLVRVPIEIRP